MFLCISAVCFYKLLNGNPLYHMCLFISKLGAPKWVSSLGQLKIKLLLIFVYRFLCEHKKFSFLFGEYLGEGLLNCMLSVCLTLVRSTGCFPKWMYTFIFSPIKCESPRCSPSFQALSTVRVFVVVCCFSYSNI